MNQPLTTVDRALLPRARRALARVLGATSALVLAGALAGCSGGTTGVNDATPAPSDSSDGPTTIYRGDGSITVDEEDGTVLIEGDNGSATFSAGSELPEGWPADVPVVEGKILFAQSADVDGTSTYSVSVATTSSPQAQYPPVRDALLAAGFERVAEATGEGGALATFSGNGWTILVTVGESDAGSAVYYSVTPSS